jgi:hypothetical protein
VALVQLAGLEGEFGIRVEEQQVRIVSDRQRALAWNPESS